MNTTATPTRPHPALELLGRYRAVLGAAWALRHDLAGPRRLADERAFLPAALSLQETPPHPAPRRTMWIIMSLFSGALVWSIVGQLDIVAVAPGRIVVSERTKIIQPLETSVVRSIHVKDGDVVVAGQLLVELDATVAGADAQGVQDQLAAADSEAARTLALLDALKSGTPPSLKAAGPNAADTLAQLQAEWADLAARLARLDAEVQRREAELATHREQQAKLQAMLPLARQREADIQALSGQGFVAGHSGQDRMRERIEVERDLATQTARVAEAQAALVESRQSRQAMQADARRQLSERQAKARLQQAHLRQEGRKSDLRQDLTRLVAPVAGTVQQLVVHTPGGVVTAAQPLMVIVPQGADVTAEVVLENKDIGFVRVGQEVAVKVDAFPFAQYGTVRARVSRVAADAVVDDKTGLAVYPATVTLSNNSVDVDGRRVALAAGMSIKSEIRIGKRSVIDFLSSPLRVRVAESLGER